MSECALPLAPSQDQQSVTAYFNRAANFWDTVYAEGTLQGRIYRERLGVALAWIDELKLPPSASILEIGCGAGLLSVALAQAGYHVDASDASPAMLQMVRKNACENKVADRIRPLLSDVQQLALADARYDLVLAIGVIPWVRNPQAALGEMTRVLKPGGYLLVTADNSWRLNFVLDPKLSPLVSSPRHGVSTALRRLHLLPAVAPLGAGEAHRYHSPRQMRRALDAIHLERVKDTTVGFGPFSFWGRILFSEPFGIKAHVLLQGICRRVSVLCLSGAQYLAVVKKQLTPG